MYFAFSWSIRELYARVLYGVIWRTMMGRSEDCVSHVHTQRQRLALLSEVCAKRSRIQYQNLETNTLHYLGILECLSACTVCAGAFQQLACSCQGVSLFCSAACPLPSRVSFSIQRFWVPAAPGSEPSLLGKASSFSRTQVPVPFLAFS